MKSLNEKEVAMRFTKRKIFLLTSCTVGVAVKSENAYILFCYSQYE